MDVEENPFACMQYPCPDGPKHGYCVSFSYSEQEPIMLMPSVIEPHRWYPAGREALAVIPNKLDVFCQLLMVVPGGRSIGEHTQSVPLTQHWVVENVEKKEDFISSIVWKAGRFESCSVKMEHHMPLYLRTIG